MERRPPRVSTNSSRTGSVITACPGSRLSPFRPRSRLNGACSHMSRSASSGASFSFTPRSSRRRRVDCPAGGGDGHELALLDRERDPAARRRSSARAGSPSWRSRPAPSSWPESVRIAKDGMRVSLARPPDPGGPKEDSMTHSLRLALPFAALLAATPLLAQPAFDGLGLGLGNLSRLSPAKTRSISPESFTGEKGKAGHGRRGDGGEGRARPRPGLEGLAVGAHQAEDHVHHGRRRGAGRHPAHLDDADRAVALPDPALLLGRRDDAVRRGAGRRLLRLRLGRLRADLLARGVREPGQRLQQLLGDAVPQGLPGHRREPGRRAR